MIQTEEKNRREKDANFANNGGDDADGMGTSRSGGAAPGKKGAAGAASGAKVNQNAKGSCVAGLLL